MLTYNPAKVEITNPSIGITMNNNDYATESSLNEIHNRVMSIWASQASSFNMQQNLLSDIKTNTGFSTSITGGVNDTADNTGDIKDKLPPLTATPTYFEFTALNVNDSAVSRLVQNSTGSTVYVTQICIFYNFGNTGVDYNEWLPTTGAIEHVIDVSSSNNNYPTDSERVMLEAETYPELIRRYNVTWDNKNHATLSNNFRSQYFYVKFDRPILLENNNYVRVYKNGDASVLNDYHITVQGYYHQNIDITTPIII